jgi:hypothetical protein
MQSVKHFLLPIRSRQNRFDNSKPTKSFLNQSQSKQTITDQTNLSYSFNTNAIVYVDSELNKIVVESKQN